MKSDRQEKYSGFSAFILHLHPRLVPGETIRFTLSFGLGGICAVLFVLLVITGLLQLLAYTPRADAAYLSILNMYQPGHFAGFVRNIHYWAGNLLVVFAALHLLRVFLTGALNGARRYNWLVGLAMFILLLFSAFTGYLLPWDQLAYWAVTIFTNMAAYAPFFGEGLAMTLRGGMQVGSTTLANFFALHVGVLPFILVILLFFHFWLIRKAGGLVQREGNSGSVEKVAVAPYLIVREAAVAMSVLALVLLFSSLVDAPLASPANPGASPNPAKAAWYFMGFQELLAHLHPAFGAFIVPLLILIGAALIPFFPATLQPGGTWCGTHGGKWRAAGSFIAGLLVTFGLIVGDEKILKADTTLNAGTLSRGLLPTCIGLVLLFVGYQLLRRFKWSRADVVLALFCFLCAALVALTATGIWLRGPGMLLVWP